MTNFSLVSYIVLLLCLQTTINSQQTCPTFYAAANLQGNSFQMCSGGFVDPEWSEISSIYVPPGYSVHLYHDTGDFGEDFGLFTQGSYNSVSISGTNVINVSYNQVQNQTQTSNQTCPTFYRNENQQGDSFQMCSSGDVPGDWNDQASSFYIPAGYLVVLYEDSDYNGQSIGPYGQGSSNLPVNFDKKLSSVIVSQPSTQNCPTFYKQNNQQGDSFQMCSSGDVPSGWNDQALSFYVPPSYSVQLYQDSGFSGQNLGSYTEGSYDVPTNGQLSSVMVSQNQSPVVAEDANGNIVTTETTAVSEPTNSNPAVVLASPVDISTPANASVPVASPINTNADAVVPIANSSVAQAESVGQSKPANRRCPVFYRDIDHQGDSFMLCSSGDVPSSWNDQVSSFYVPPGYYVKLYPNRKYSGRNFGTYSQGFYNVPSNYNDQLSSVMMIKK